jgi:ribose transport system ATP-binding protein
LAESLVVIEGLNKHFPGVHALRDARFELREGEIHALVGENGAGKSTMMKVLAGVYQKDSGSVRYKGAEVDIHSPRQAQRLGIGIIHQELNLMNHLSAAQNIFIGREPRRGIRFMLDERRLNQEADELFARLNLRLDPRTKIGDMTVAKQQMVEIAKALSFDSRVLIMDEPTAALNEEEIEDLFLIIRQLKANGVGIAYISHRMDELKRISDRVTVMRDGAWIDTLVTADTDIDTIISLMVGRTLFETAIPARAGNESDIALEVRGLNRGRAIRDVSFKVRKGEILGLAGLMGAGRTEVARAVFGADPIDSGEILVGGKPVRVASPSDAVRHGIGYLSEDRKRFGLATGLDVETNVVLATMARYMGLAGILKQPRIRTTADKFVKALSIKTPGLRQKVKFLSGGNQQKVVVAKWLDRDCGVLFFDEPTRGIDVGAKQEIYKLLNDLAASGKAIVMISSELPEILRMSHRILVMCEGRLTGELHATEANQEKIMQLATQRETLVAAARTAAKAAVAKAAATAAAGDAETRKVKR